MHATTVPWSSTHFDSDGRTIRFVNYQETDPIARAVREIKSSIKPNTGPARGKYLGTVPLILCERWAKECGAAIGTKEWKAYAVGKLRSDEFKEFRGE